VYYYFVININQQTKGKANMILKLTQMCTLAAIAMVWQVCAASSRTVSTATMYKPKLLELSEQHPTVSAVSRSRSVEETLKIRLTNSALRQIDPSIVHVPKTELEFLESAFGVAKSIR
jgi:hypothetical protein